MTSLYFWQEKKEDENRKSWDESAEEYGGQRKPRQSGVWLERGKAWLIGSHHPPHLAGSRPSRRWLGTFLQTDGITLHIQR